MDDQTPYKLNAPELPEQYALLAFYEGVISSPQLRRSLRVWLQGQRAEDLMQIVRREGEISSDLHFKLLDRLQYEMERLPNRSDWGANSPQVIEPPPEEVAPWLSAGNELPQAVYEEVSDAEPVKTAEHSEERKKRERTKRKHRQREPYDYYDSFHNDFSHWSSKRSAIRSIQRFGSNCKVLAELAGNWFWDHRRSLVVAGCGMIVLAGAIFVSSNLWQSAQTLPPNIAPSSVATSQTIASPAHASQDTSIANTEPALPPRLEIPAEEERPPSPKRRNLPRGAVVSTAAHNEESSETPFGKTASSRKVSPIDLLLSQANDRLSLKKYAEAVALIDESIARDANFDTIEVRKALVASLLGSKDYVRAGQLLASINIVSSQQLEWNLLYTIWLFHASAESRSEVLALLREHALQNGQSDEVLGKIAWIEARSKNPSVALAILAKTARAARCSFGDALFYSVALQYAGQAEQALEQLDRAEQMVNSELSELSGSSISDAALLSYAEPTVQRALVAYRASLAR